jgi:hypothetical protein
MQNNCLLEARNLDHPGKIELGKEAGLDDIPAGAIGSSVLGGKLVKGTRVVEDHMLVMSSFGVLEERRCPGSDKLRVQD